jgi:outer membrane protein TolC
MSLGLLLLSGSVTAQENPATTTRPAVTNNPAAPAGIQASSPMVIPSDTTSAPAIRPVSLTEVISTTLAKNFDIQIERLTPLINEYNLNATYGVYEPALDLSSSHSVFNSPGGFDQFGVPRPSTTRRSDDFGLSIGPSGYLPSGLTYGLDANVSHNVFSTGIPEQYNSGWQVNMRQPLLRDFWIDAPRRSILIAKKQLERSEWEFRRQIIQSITDVEDAYYQLIFMREAVKVQRTGLDLANQLLRENKKRVEVGALAPLDEKQAESEVARSLAALIEAEQNYAVQQNTLKNLMTDDYKSIVDVTLDPVESLVAVPSDTDLADSWKRGLSMRPELQMLKSDIERNKIDLKFYKNQIFPALDLFGTYGETDIKRSYSDATKALFRDDNPRYSAGIALSIPLGNTRARNNYKAAQELKNQANLLYKQMEQMIMVQIDNAIKVLRSEFQKVEATRQARLFAQDALSAEQKKLENGKSTSYLVLLSQRDLTQRRFEEIQALANYNRALAGLAQQTGGTLERHSLALPAGQQ